MKRRMEAFEKISLTVIIGVLLLALAAMVIVAVRTDLDKTTIVILAGIPGAVITGLFGFLVGGPKKDQPVPQILETPPAEKELKETS